MERAGSTTRSRPFARDTDTFLDSLSTRFPWASYKRSTPIPPRIARLCVARKQVDSQRDLQSSCLPGGDWQKNSNFQTSKIIFAHLGGSTPFLAPRVAVLSHHMRCPLSPEEILQDFGTFYYETALSSHEATLAAIEAFVPADHILFGSDFPDKVLSRNLPFTLISSSCQYSHVRVVHETSSGVLHQGTRRTRSHPASQCACFFSKATRSECYNLETFIVISLDWLTTCNSLQKAVVYQGIYK
ncbi:hypothetical protein V8B97DRAFT_80219 [Scleroderma yunnanense]